MRCKNLILMLALCILAPHVNAQLVFTAPPRESAAKAETLYGPLAKSLSKLLGEEVVFERASNFITYSANMRKDKYDIVFDGPHFAAWRVEHLKHQVVAKLPGKLDFHVVTTNPEYRTLDDLVGRKVCALTSPNLGTVALLQLYKKNPLAGPKMAGSTGGFAGVAKDLLNGRCEIGVLRTAFYKKKLSDKEREKLRVIYTTKPMPNQAITVSPRVNENHKEKIITALTSEQGAAGASNLFGRFSKKSKHFMPTTGEEFSFLNLLLEGVVWGW